MKIVALDQATAVTGVAVFEDSTLKDCFYIRTKKTEGDTYIRMTEAIFNMLQEQQPDIVIIEGVTYQKSAKTTIVLSQLRGTIIGWCVQKGVKLISYLPSAWRKMLGFKQGRTATRTMLKKQAQDFVKKHYDVEVSEDEADAICIGCAYWCANEAYASIEQLGTIDENGQFLLNKDGGI